MASWRYLWASENLDGKPWSKFEAWPALRVAGCWLIDNSTALNIATVRELHTARLTSGMELAIIHVLLESMQPGVLPSLLSPLWCSCIVDLRIDDVCCSWYGAPDVNQILEACLHLQTPHLVEQGMVKWNDYGVKVALDEGYSGQLKDLKLKIICCSILDLESATCLTSISLINIEACCMPCDLVLPSSVERLEFIGYSLVTRHAKYVLEGLSSLKQVTLGLPYPCGTYLCIKHRELISFAHIPTLPGSLCHLRVTDYLMKGLLDRSAKRCLRYCTGLEHLTLPADEDPEEELYAWVKAARHLHVLDNDPGRQDV